MGMYGEGLQPYGSFVVKRAGEFTENDGTYNIITVGTYESSGFLQAINEDLHFSYSEDGTRFESNRQLILAEDYAGDIAILQLLSSPYDGGKVILALTGTSEESLNAAAELLRDRTSSYQLNSDCVIIDENRETRAFRFTAPSKAGEELSFVQNMTQNKQSVLFTVVATSVMLMLLIAVIIILLRIRSYHRRRDDE